MASRLVCLTPDRVVWLRALARVIVLCSWARHLTLAVPLKQGVQMGTGKFHAVIGYLSRQDRAILPPQDYPLCLAFSAKMAGYWPHSFFDSVSVHEHAKKITWPISSHLDFMLVQEPIFIIG